MGVRNSCLRNGPSPPGWRAVVLRLLTTLAAEKRTFPPAIAAGGGDGRWEGNSWVAEIDSIVVKRSTTGTSPVAIKPLLIRA